VGQHVERRDLLGEHERMAVVVRKDETADPQGLRHAGDQGQRRQRRELMTERFGDEMVAHQPGRVAAIFRLPGGGAQRLGRAGAFGEQAEAEGAGAGHGVLEGEAGPSQAAVVSSSRFQPRIRASACRHAATNGVAGCAIWRRTRGHTTVDDRERARRDQGKSPSPTATARPPHRNDGTPEQSVAQGPTYLATSALALRRSSSSATAAGTQTLLTGLRMVPSDLAITSATGMPTMDRHDRKTWMALRTTNTSPNGR